MDCCVYSADVQLDFPKEWGDPTKIIYPSYGDNLHDRVWRHFERWISMSNQYPEPGRAHMSDLCTGFDIQTVRVRVMIDGDMELLESTIVKMKEALYRAYMQIPHRNRQLAKAA